LIDVLSRPPVNVLKLCHGAPGSLLFCVGSVCQPGGVHDSLKPAAAASIVLFAVGLPLVYIVILVQHRLAFRMSQGVTGDTTTDIAQCRRRYHGVFRCVDDVPSAHDIVVDVYVPESINAA
jgi:hypothetical protein